MISMVLKLIGLQIDSLLGCLCHMLGAIFDFARTFFSLRRIKMSHKRPSKRGINTIDYTSSDYSPTSKSLPQKRPRIEEYSEFQVQTKSPDETPSARRRSSRAPKPKVFDDEYMDTSVRSPGSDREFQKKKDPKASVSRDQGERRSIDDALVVIDDQYTSTTRRSSRVPKPKIFDEDYVEPTKIKGTNDKNEKSMAYATDPKILQDEQKDISQKSKIQNKDKIKGKITSKNINQQDVGIAVGPKKTVAGAQKPKKTGSNSKHVKASPIAESELPPQRAVKSNEELDAKGSPKVRTSSRTPVPKKTFALIDDSPISKPADSIQGEEDLHMGVLSQGLHGSKPSEKISLTQSDSSLTSGEEIDIIHASPFIGKKKGNPKLQEAGSDGEKKKKISKKSKAGSDSLDVSKDVMARETTKHLEGKKSGSVMGNIAKDKSKKGSSKDIDSKIDINKGDVKRKKKDDSESIVDVVGEMPKEVKKKSKKKKVEVEEVALQQNISNAANSTPGSHEAKHSFSEHGKKSSKHSKTKHKDEPHSEVKDEDHHIILKVHLPHAEGSHHSHSSHKKHKHKHSSESRSGTESDSKAKKRKLSLESDSSSEDKHKKKLSIKFKGLSSSTPGVEFEGAKEPVGKEKGKKNKDLGSEGTNKKASKKASDDKPSVASSSDEKEHVKVVIKKTKQDIKVLTDDTGEKSVKKGANKGGKEKVKEDKEQKTEASTSSKTTPKKKSKAGESPKSAEKEKRKIVSGYLLFCKKERSRINEANPGLEFAQISQKVGEAWKNLPESTRQEWKAKANDVKRTLLVQQEQKKAETTCTKSGTDAVDMAAHLKLLGESLSVIGASLMAQRETEVHGSLSVLLDSILCAICPLTFLTSHIPGIPGIAKDKQLQILDDLAYTMPGLG